MAEKVYLIKVNGRSYLIKSYKEAVEAFLAASEGDDVQVFETTPKEIIDSIPGEKIGKSTLWKSGYKKG